MRRIVILGNAGSGKSTLARQMGERLGLPVFHLDALNWEPGWRSIPAETLRSRLREITSRDEWIVDGNYALLTFDLSLTRADRVIWLERPRLACICRVLRRAARSYFRADEDLARGCKERFDGRFLSRLRFIVNFDRVNRPRIEKERLKHGPHVPVTVLRGDRMVAGFLDTLGNAAPCGGTRDRVEQ